MVKSFNTSGAVVRITFPNCRERCILNQGVGQANTVWASTQGPWHTTGAIARITETLAERRGYRADAPKVRPWGLSLFRVEAPAPLIYPPTLADTSSRGQMFVVEK